jgi:hypothetical protein
LWTVASEVKFAITIEQQLFLESLSKAPQTTVVGANLCARDPLEIKCKGIRGVGGVADKEAEAVHTINIISQRQYFVARYLISYVGNSFGLHRIEMRLFSFYPQASDVGKTQRFVPTTVPPSAILVWKIK